MTSTNEKENEVSEIKVPIIRPFEISTEQTGTMVLNDFIMEFKNLDHLVITCSLLDAQNYDLIKENKELLRKIEVYKKLVIPKNMRINGN